MRALAISMEKVTYTNKTLKKSNSYKFILCDIAESNFTMTLQ